MVRHSYHILYMIHPLRGVYDSYTGRTSRVGYFLESPFKFAGIWMRKIIHLLDNHALSPSRIKGYYVISRTVGQRNGYFPPGCQPEVLYPPSPFELDHHDPQHDSQPQIKWGHQPAAGENGVFNSSFEHGHSGNFI